METIKFQELDVEELSVINGGGLSETLNKAAEALLRYITEPKV